MKNSPNKLNWLIICFSLIFVFSACNREQQEITTLVDQDQQEEMVQDVQEQEDLTGVGYEPQIADHVADHGINLDVTEEFDLLLPDGTSEKKLLVDGCIAMGEREYREMLNDPERQYRTYNLVTPQVITIVGWNAGTYSLTSKGRTALSWAVNNYNALNTGMTFSLSYGTSSSGADIVVYRNPYNTGAGGVAGFPYSNGQPYKWVQIYGGMENYSYNVNEHVITHEIGHCMGLRHTDYFSRASCGQNSNEGSGSSGAVHVPGTPTGIDWNSVMLACFSSSEDGEFGYYDRVALEYLY